MKPTRSLHPNPKWRYVSAAKTDLWATFRRLAREREEAEAKTNVQPMKRKAAK